MKLFLLVVLGSSFRIGSCAFGVLSHHQRYATGSMCGVRPLYLSSEPQDSHPDSRTEDDKKEVVDSETLDSLPEMTEEEKKEVVGNLVANDEWEGLTLELAELVRLSIVEDVKKNARDFLGKDDYKLGDFSKKVDTRVKDQVAMMRDKEEYELGDLSLALDSLSKELTCELTGKDDYEFGDLSIELDKRVKNAVSDFCGTESYQFGDLSKEINRRIKDRVAEFTHSDKPYEFGDISKEINERRKKWMLETLGEEAAANYQFGDVSKKLLSSYLGKDKADDYQFGDVTKKLIGDLFAGKKKKKRE